jgi:DNA-binding MarR family transcriptional regulator
LFFLLQRVSQLTRGIGARIAGDSRISGPRFWLMFRLFMEDSTGNGKGLTPTVLSESQRVSKNTISSLLRGLESQGLIERQLDKEDLRAFRIRLTQAGQDCVRATALSRMRSVKEMVSVLSAEEQAQLVALLRKLQMVLIERYRPGCGPDEAAAAEEADASATKEQSIP